MRAPFPLAFVVSPLPHSASSRLHPGASGTPPVTTNPPSFPVATFAPAILLFRSQKIEYLCKLNGGGIDGRRQIDEVGREDNHMVRVNLGNNQEGRSNLAKNFRMGSERTIMVG